MQAGDGLLRILECEVSHLIILPVFFASIGGARSVPPLFSDGFDDAAVPEVMRPGVVDGAVCIRSTLFLPANRMRVSSRFACRGFHRSDQLGGSLALFFFFPSEDGPAWGSEALASLTSGRPDCRSRASAALAHLSVRAKSSVGEEITLVASFSAILRSRTPRRKAMQTDSLEILAIIFRHWQKRWMYLQRDSPLRCCTW